MTAAFSPNTGKLTNPWIRKRDAQGYEQACKSHLVTDYSSRGFLWYKKETLAHDEKRDFGEWTQKDPQNKKETVAFWKIKCNIPHVLPTKNMTPSHFSSTVLLLSFLSPFFLPHQFFMPLPSPWGGDQRVKEIHQCLLKSLCCLINKEGGWIRKLNHVGLLMSLPTDKHEILCVWPLCSLP